MASAVSTFHVHAADATRQGRVLGRSTASARSTARAPALADPSPPLPPSARVVLAALDATGPRTHKALVEGSALPARTVRYALARLVELGLVEQVPSLRDARQSFYRVAGSRGRQSALRAVVVPARDIRGLA